MLTKGVPAYRRIQSAIRRIIEAGELKPGDVVASERELARLHNVSLMTARHALVSLEREGIVERRRSVGTFVAAPKIHFNKLMSYTEQMGSRRLTPVSKILFAKIIENDEEATARGPEGIKQIERLFRNERLLARPNVVFTPHVAFNSVEAVERIVRQPKPMRAEIGHLGHSEKALV